MNRFHRFVASALVASLIAGCYEVPVTGRSALNLVDDNEVTKMSIGLFDGLKRKYRILNDRDRNAQLQRIGDRISKVVFWDMPHAEWEFVIFDDKQVNAFAMAGGKVGVFSGLLKIAKTDDELAAVIAHEIAHVTAKHINQKLSQQLAVNTVGVVGSIGMGVAGTPWLTAAALESAYGLSAGVGVLAYDRKKEKEADFIGMMYMARAGYDPRAAITIMERLEAESANRSLPPALLSTHPTHPERIIAMMDAMPKAEKVRAESQAQQAAPIIIK